MTAFWFTICYFSEFLPHQPRINTTPQNFVRFVVLKIGTPSMAIARVILLINFNLYSYYGKR